MWKTGSLPATVPQRQGYRSRENIWKTSQPELRHEKEHNPKLLSLAHGGGQKVRHVSRNLGNHTFLAGYPGMLLGYPCGARKV